MSIRALPLLTLVWALYGSADPLPRVPPFVGSDLNFSLPAGHYIFRKGTTAAHVQVANGLRPNVTVAFPAGNSGTSLWFEPRPDLNLAAVGAVDEAPAEDRMHGITLVIQGTGAPLIIENSILGSVRHIRDYEDVQKIKPPEVQEAYQLMGPTDLNITRFVNANHHYTMSLHLKTAGAAFLRLMNGRWEILPPQPGGAVQFQLTARTSETPLTPIAFTDLLRPEVLSTADPLLVKMLAFMAYKEKFLAGSWRYLTYFGRDSLISTQLMMEVLQPEAIAAALGSVLDRLSPEGVVAHEESIGDFALFLSARDHDAVVTDTPRMDRKMIDANYLLLPILVKYLRNQPPMRVAEFFARRTPGGLSYHDVLRRNIDFVLRQTAAFARDPRFQNLIQLKPGETTGQWRDSDPGLGYGRYPYDVNAALVPAALKAIAQLEFDQNLGFFNVPEAKLALSYHRIWSERAVTLFDISVPAAQVQEFAVNYANQQGINLPRRLNEGEIDYSAIALNADGSPVQVMNSDEGALLLFGEPSEQRLVQIANRVLLPFPFGLRTPIGLLIANAAFAPPSTQVNFTRDHYHGLVVWSWQQLQFAQGLDEQARRLDISKDTRQILLRAKATLATVMAQTKPFQNAELWTWEPVNGQMVHVVYGSKPQHHTIANPIQLWSEAVGLAGSVKPQADLTGLPGG